MVLKDSKAFKMYFTNSPTLVKPRLAFKINSTRFIHKSTASVIDAGTSQINTTISDLMCELTDFQREQMENNNLTQHQVAAIHVNMESQTCTISLIGNQLQQFSFTLLTGHDERVIESCITSIDTTLAFKMMCLHGSMDTTKRDELTSSITTNKQHHHELSE